MFAGWHAGKLEASEEVMNNVIGGIALLFLVGGTGSSADAAPSWCVFYDGSTYNCSFCSWEQCYETAFANGGWCRPNFFQGYTGGQPGAPRDRKPRGSRY